MTTTSWSTIDTPTGPFGAVVDSDGTVLASGWTRELHPLLETIPKPRRPDEPREVRDVGAVTRAILDYHAGDITAIDGIPVRQHGGPFIEHAWEMLRKVPAGEPVSYSELATLAGRPQAIRAAASACSNNATALFVPCHRVLRGDGSLGGFRWGLDTKRWLLEHEQNSVVGG